MSNIFRKYIRNSFISILTLLLLVIATVAKAESSVNCSSQSCQATCENNDVCTYEITKKNKGIPFLIKAYDGAKINITGGNINGYPWVQITVENPGKKAKVTLKSDKELRIGPMNREAGCSLLQAYPKYVFTAKKSGQSCDYFYISH